MSTPFFSIVIPVYKVRAEYFDECIGSICNQNFSDFEIILVEDGSPDNCGELCDEYARKDSRIRVIHKANEGVSVARNTGIESAKGKWIIFVDADDMLKENACGILAEKLEAFDGEILMYSHLKGNSQKQTQPKYNLVSEKIYNTSLAEECETLYRIAMRPNQVGNHGVYFCWDKVYSRDFLMENNLRFPVGLPKSEDKVFTLLCFEKIKKFMFIDKPFYFYRVNEESVCNRYSENADKDRIELAKVLMPIATHMDKHMGKMKKQDNYALLMGDCKRFLFGIISDVLSLKFYHPDCPYSNSERNKMAKAFVKTEPFNSCIRDMKYSQLSMATKMKKFLLQKGFVKLYYNIYATMKK